MLPRLRIVISRENCVDFATLGLLAARAEWNYRDAGQYCAPPPPEHSVCPNLAYRPPSRAQRPSSVMAATDLGVLNQINESRDKRGNAVPKKESVCPAPPKEPNAAIPREQGTQANEAPQATAANKNAKTPATVKCWNCGSDSHLSRNCSELPRVHCYRCGRQGYTIRTCPTCAGNGGRKS